MSFIKQNSNHKPWKVAAAGILVIGGIALIAHSSRPQTSPVSLAEVVEDAAFDRCDINELNNFSVCMDDSWCQGERQCDLYQDQTLGRCHGESMCDEKAIECIFHQET
jgi:hypothetical protein